MVFFLEGLNVTPREVQNNFDETGFLNPFKTKDPELTELTSQVALEPNETKASELYKKINAHIVENALTAPLFYIGTIWATKDGIEYNSDGSNTASNIRQFSVVK